MDNILFCSCGRRVKLLQNFRKSMKDSGKIIATDLSPVAPALFMADSNYLMPVSYTHLTLPTNREV